MKNDPNVKSGGLTDPRIFNVVYNFCQFLFCFDKEQFGVVELYGLNSDMKTMSVGSLIGIMHMHSR